FFSRNYQHNNIQISGSRQTIKNKAQTENVANIQYAQLKSVNKIALSPVAKVLIPVGIGLGTLIIVSVVLLSQPGF
ncbi:MAG: hypothetical protein ABI891_06945, partial [Acidobacteriota bacterium]